MSKRQIVTAVASATVLLAAGALVWSAVLTSSARVSATTSGDAFFAAGEIALDQPGTSIDLLFDDEGLYPGSDVLGCVLVSYSGTIPATIRLHGRRTSGTGLEEYVDFRVWIDEGCDLIAAGPDRAQPTPIFDGRLSELWSSHGTFDRGIDLVQSAQSGDQVSVWASASVVDDNQAQGLITGFTLTVEARP